MRDEKQSGLPRLLRQALHFVGLSGVGWLLDMGVYTLLSTRLPDLALANTLSSLVGVTFVFIFSTRLVFADNHRLPLWVKYAAYVVYQLVLIFLISQLLARINAALVAWLAGTALERFCAILAKIIVTPLTMTVNFFVMKLLIEKI